MSLLKQFLMDNFQPLDWQVENLRLTAFPSPSVQFNLETNWWADLMGVPPENSILQARQGILRQEGQLEDKRLTLTIHPDRINWLVAASEVEEAIALPVIGPFEEMLSIFLPLMFRWFESDTCPPLSRLAFGAILLSPIDSKQLGYQQLDRLLPSVELDTEGISDFLYKINRPRATTTQIEELQINRLSTWSVATLRQVNFIMGQTVSASQRSEVFACRLELDINTNQDFNDELQPVQLPEIFNELVDFGREIAREGDVS